MENPADCDVRYNLGNAYLETGDRAAILAAHRTAEGQSFLRFARFPASEAHRHGEQIEVVIRDLRFFPPSDLFRLRILLDKNLHQVAEPSSN